MKQDSELNSDNKGFIVSCEDSMIISEIIYNDSPVALNVKLDLANDALVDSGSKEKFSLFLDEVNKYKAAVDWEINLKVDKDAVSYHMAGMVESGRLYIFAAETNKELMRLIFEMAKVGNEQANLIRSVSKENIRLKASTEKDSTLYDEISRLNNDLVNLQRELTQKNQKLAELNSLKNTFLGMAAHDLRNPLSNITMLSEMLLEDDVPDETAKKYHRHIISLSTYMTDLISELLDVSVIENGIIELNIKKNSLNDVVEKVIFLNKLYARRKEIKIVFTPLIHDCVLMFDKEKIEQVITNLISNAIKYSPKNSEVLVKIEQTENYSVLRVADQGPGIPPEKKEKIFKPFSKIGSMPTDGEKSTGLGLFICKRIIDAHNGIVGVEPNADKGSVFFVKLECSVSLDDGLS